MYLVLSGPHVAHYAIEVIEYKVFTRNLAIPQCVSIHNILYVFLSFSFVNRFINTTRWELIIDCKNEYYTKQIFYEELLWS